MVLVQQPSSPYSQLFGNVGDDIGQFGLEAIEAADLYKSSTKVSVHPSCCWSAAMIDELRTMVGL